jgi:hypothetical protein
VTVFTSFVARKTGVRIHLSADEWDRLSIGEGERVKVALPDGRQGDHVIWRLTWCDPGYWVELKDAQRSSMFSAGTR